MYIILVNLVDLGHTLLASTVASRSYYARHTVAKIKLVSDRKTSSTGLRKHMIQSAVSFTVCIQGSCYCNARCRLRETQTDTVIVKDSLYILLNTFLV